MRRLGDVRRSDQTSKALLCLAETRPVPLLALSAA